MAEMIQPSAPLPPWVGQLAKYLGAAFPAWKVTPETMVVYFDALRDIDPSHIAGAARAYVRDCHEFAPSAGQLRKLALDLRRANRPHAEDCCCADCINALPVAERWPRLSPTMRATLEREQPDVAAALKDAAPLHITRAPRS